MTRTSDRIKWKLPQYIIKKKKYTHNRIHISTLIINPISKITVQLLFTGKVITWHINRNTIETQCVQNSNIFNNFKRNNCNFYVYSVQTLKASWSMNDIRDSDFDRSCLYILPSSVFVFRRKKIQNKHIQYYIKFITILKTFE